MISWDVYMNGDFDSRTRFTVLSIDIFGSWFRFLKLWVHDLLISGI